MAGPDTGGMHGFDDGSAITQANVHSYVHTTSAWTQSTDWQRFVGYLEPPSAPPAAPIEAAFEMFAPRVLDPNEPILLVIGNWHTVGHPEAEKSIYEYPGDDADGLVRSALDGTIRRMLEPEDWIGATHPGLPTNVQPVLCNYVMPLWSVRPQIFTHQRLLQLRRALELMLLNPNAATHPILTGGGLTPLTIEATALVGSSNGALTNATAILFWPDRFQAAASTGFAPNLETVIDQHEWWQVSSGLSGFGPAGKGTAFLDVLQMSALWGALGTDLHSKSSTRRWHADEVKRPQIYVVSDEDTAGGGTEWIPTLSGAASYDERGTASNNVTQIWWSRIDRRCHLGGNFVSPTLNPPVQYTSAKSVIEAQREVLALAYAERNTPQAAMPASSRLVSDIGGHSPYRAPLARSRQQIAAAPTIPGLAEDPNWVRYGLGTCLGYDESLVVDGDDIYVGSADGVVSECRLGVQGEIVTIQQSEPLGYGAWGLAVGPVAAGGTRVVVGTHQALHLLDPAVGMAEVGRFQFSGFEEIRPRRIEIADVFSQSGNNQNEILLTTFGGKLMVFDFGLNCIGQYFEPGVIDFIVQPFRTAPIGTDNTASNTITIASARGVLANIELGQCNQGGPVHAALVASSTHLDPVTGDPRYGEIVDIEPTQYGPNGSVAVLYRTTGANDTVRLFDARTLELLVVMPWSVGNALSVSNGRNTSPLNVDFCVVHDGQDPGFVVCGPWTELRYRRLSGGAVLPTQTEAFPPAYRPQALAVLGGGTAQERVVLASEAGYLSWIDASTLQAGGSSLPTRQAVSGTTLFQRSSQNLTATWGMVVDEENDALFAADQTGSLWEVTDPTTGAFSLVEELVAGATSVSFGEPLSPIRDLALVGDLVGVGQHFPPVGFPGQRHFVAGNLWIDLDPYSGAFSTIADDDQSDVMRPSTSLQLQLFDRFFPHFSAQSGFVPFSAGGDILESPGAWRAHFWQGNSWIQEPQPYANQVLGVFATVGGTPSASTLVGGWHTFPPTLSVGDGPSETKDLRNSTSDAYGGAPFQMQSLRALSGVGGGAGIDLLVLSTAGGGFVLLEPGSSWEGPNSYGTILYPSSSDSALDDGWGGSGLAVRVNAGGLVEVYQGISTAHDDPSTSIACGAVTRTMLSVTTSPSAASVVSHDVLRLDAALPGVSRDVVGVCGLRIGDVLPNEVGDELVVTSYLGDLLILDLDGATWDRVIGHTWVGGSLGAHNAIEIIDIDGDPGNEVYVAGSLGLRKFVRNP